MILIHMKTNRTIAKNIKIADSFFSRLIGLTFVKEMKGMDALLLIPGNSIHNCFVRFAIDVIFIDKENKVVKVIRGFKPWRFTRIYFSANKVLEMKAGTLIADIEKGDQLEVRGV
jgi:uncharacterized membrane protein (UPF0127 family)